MRVHVIGLGLIGGSLSFDIKDAFAEAKVYGYDLNKANEERALALGFIDDAFAWDELHLADIVILSIPVDAQQSALPKVLDGINDDALVFDAGSTKAKLCEVVAQHPKRRNFLATHPIAGTEFSGPDAAVRGLFQNKTNIICEVEKTAFKLQEKGLEIFRKIGMRIRYMDPKSHDKHIAYVSHLSHISSFMLGKTVIDKEQNERDIFDMAGSGFESTVRLAKSSPAMWTPIFKENKENILETLEEYIQNLERFKELMEADNFDEVFQTMENTNHIKTILKGIQ
ncbi:MAG: prephenate dehydrogenase [Polaribacter sp.]